jgi:predicted DNA-binding transcriptional regulator AlpA
MLRLADLAGTRARPGKLGVSRRTLSNWVRQGIFPPPTKLGPRVIGWPASQVDAWIEQQRGKS